MSAQDTTGAPSGAETDNTLRLVGEFDASIWAREFKRLNPASDESVMLGWFANAIMAGYDHHAKLHRAQVRELDVALNGEVGAAPQASLCDLVAQVRRQHPVQILNMTDGMRINFRAPDGRRATLYMNILLSFDVLFSDPTVPETMRDAIAAYPSAGELTPADHALAAQARHVRQQRQAQTYGDMQAMVERDDNAQVQALGVRK